MSCMVIYIYNNINNTKIQNGVTPIFVVATSDVGKYIIGALLFIHFTFDISFCIILDLHVNRLKRLQESDHFFNQLQIGCF